jgi:Pyruvate/2-oxoacid:ferredoxin oxidoreductase gamma subunit
MRWFIFLPLAILVVLFMLSNPQSIELRLWPFDLAWTASAAIAVLSIAAIAFLLGALIAWAAALPARRRGRAAERRVIELEANLKTLSAAREAADQKALTKA